MEGLIKRSDAIKALDVGFYKDEIELAIREIPSADKPQGEWIDWLGKGNEWECSVCRCSIESHGSIAYNFCPMCGAMMKGGRNGRPYK